MSLQGHLHTLQAKHIELKNQITDEMHRPLPDFILITQLKKQKLAVKQEMERFSKAVPRHASDVS